MSILRSDPILLSRNFQTTNLRCYHADSCLHVEVERVFAWMLSSRVHKNDALVKWLSCLNCSKKDSLHTSPPTATDAVFSWPICSSTEPCLESSWLLHTVRITPKFCFFVIEKQGRYV